MKWRRSLFAVGLAFIFCAAPTRAAQTAAPDAKKQEAAAAAKKAEASDTKKPEPPAEKPFAELIKDAKTINGLFILYQTEEKVYLEIRPDQFDKMYMISLTCESGIGERGFYARTARRDVTWTHQLISVVGARMASVKRREYL